MKLLYLTPSPPSPPTSGARIRNLGLLCSAAREHEVDLLTFGQPGDAAGLAPLARRVSVVEPPARPLADRALDLVQRPLPDLARRLWSVPFLEALHEMLGGEQYDVVQGEGLEMAPYLGATGMRRGPGTRPLVVYDAHNAEYLLQRRAFERASRQPRRAVAAAYAYMQWKRLEQYERTVVERSDLTLAVSYHDANQLEALAPGRAVKVVPNGIDVAGYAYRQPTEGDPAHLLFLGKLDYRPNAEALQWLVSAVLPGILQQVPRARLFVVGHAPPGWLVRAGQQDERIVVVGGVADERPYLARASVLLLPLAFGGGSRIKALVGAAAGVPIVSSRAGMEGLEAKPGEHFVRADDPAEWMQAVIELVSDTVRRRGLAERARALVQRRYDWATIAPRLMEAYEQLVSRHGD